MTPRDNPPDNDVDDWLVVELEIEAFDSTSSSSVSSSSDYETESEEEEEEEDDGNEADDEYESGEDDESEEEQEEEEQLDGAHLEVLRELNYELQPAPVHRTLNDLWIEIGAAEPYQYSRIIRRAIVLSPELRTYFQGLYTPSEDNKENEP